VNALAVAGSTLYVGGFFDTVGGRRRINAAAVDTFTGRTLPWNPRPGPARSFSSVEAIAVTPESVFLGGDFSHVDGAPRARLAAVNPRTGQLLRWNAHVRRGSVRSLALSGDTLYVSGSYTRIGGAPRRGLGALDIRTGKATAWMPQGSPATGWLAMGGEVIYVGDAAFDALSGERLAWDPRPTQGADPLAVVGDRVLLNVSGGIGSVDRDGLAAVDLDTGEFKAWNPGMDGGGVDALEVAGGTVYISGDFHRVGTSTRHGLAAFDAATGEIESWAPTVDGEYDRYVYQLLPYGDAVYLAGTFDAISATARDGLAAVDAASGAVLPWNPTVEVKDGDARVHELAARGRRIYLTGGFDAVNGVERIGIAAVDAETGSLAAWKAPYVDGYVNAITASENGLYIGGGFSDIGGVKRDGIAALDLATGQLQSWAPELEFDWPIPQVEAIAVVGDTVYATGEIISADGHAREGFAAFDAMTGAVKPWNPSGAAWAPLFLGVDELVVGEKALAASYIDVVHVFAPPP
jgi:hypothetical protein